VSYILDTDHCVTILRGRLDVGSRVAADVPLYVTAITVSELTYGAYKSDRPAANLAQVNTLLDGVTILAFDVAAARRCGQLKDLLRRAGTPIAEPDLQIASVALQHGLPLATHNTGHFDRVPGLALVDWLSNG
jgi:tRNA(fMet)-specific endonuclease VapC